MALRLGHLRWWHCLSLGVLVGIAAWQTQSAIEGSREPHLAVGMSLRQFVGIASSSTPSSNTTSSSARRLTDLRVHPAADGRTFVTGVELNNGIRHPFEFIAAIPFEVPAVRFLAPARSYPSVRAYLDQAAPSIGYRYTWWEEPRWNAAIWFGGPVLILGVLLPLSVALLRRVGVLAPLPVVVKEKPLPPQKPEPAKTMPEVDQADVAAQLRAATDDLEQRLAAAIAGTGEPPAAAAVGAAATAPHVFTAGPADAPLPEVAKEETSFDAGVYYPVHRPKRSE